VEGLLDAGEAPARDVHDAVVGHADADARDRFDRVARLERGHHVLVVDQDRLALAAVLLDGDDAQHLARRPLLAERFAALEVARDVALLPELLESAVGKHVHDRAVDRADDVVAPVRRVEAGQRLVGLQRPVVQELIDRIRLAQRSQAVARLIVGSSRSSAERSALISPFSSPRRRARLARSSS
jgi:hypothetical protein